VTPAHQQDWLLGQGLHESIPEEQRCAGAPLAQELGLGWGLVGAEGGSDR
jgi:hypothetical protein